MPTFCGTNHKTMCMNTFHFILLSNKSDLFRVFVFTFNNPDEFWTLNLDQIL